MSNVWEPKVEISTGKGALESNSNQPKTASWEEAGQSKEVVCGLMGAIPMTLPNPAMTIVDTQSVHVGPFTPDYMPELSIPWSPSRRYRYWVVGRLPIKSGRIAASDVIGRPLPFNRTIPRGHHSVWVIEERSSKRIVLAGIELRAGVPVQWLHAERKCTQFPRVVPIDGGAMCLCDSDAADSFDRERMPDYNSYLELLCDNRFLECGARLHRMGGHDALLVRTGYGDGCYPAYWGFGRELSEPISFAINFAPLG